MWWLFGVWKSLTGVGWFLSVKFDTLCHNKVKNRSWQIKIYHPWYMDFSTGCGKLWKIFTFDYHFRKKICYNIFFTKSVRFLFNIWLFLSIFFTGVASRFHSDFYGYNRYKIIFWAKTEHPFFVRFLAHITNEIIFCGFLSNNMIYMSIRTTHLMLRFWRIWRFWGKNDSDFSGFFLANMFWYGKWAF